MMTLSPSDRRALRARAHSLHPVVAVGRGGLTPAVVREIDVALGAHELIKIRVRDDDRDARESMLARVCAELDAAPVQHLGKLLIVFRPKPEAAAKPKPKPRRASKADEKPSGTSRRKPPAPHTGGKGAPQTPRQMQGRFGSDPRGGATGARKGAARSLAGARSNEFSPRSPPALAPETTRRRRRVVVSAATQSTDARNAPAVRRRKESLTKATRARRPKAR